MELFYIINIWLSVRLQPFQSGGTERGGMARNALPNDADILVPRQRTHTAPPQEIRQCEVYTCLVFVDFAELLQQNHLC